MNDSDDPSWPAHADRFQLETDFELRGDQPRAIDQLAEGLERGDKAQVLLGVTGSGKTFTMAQVLARVNRPALVMVHNKTLAAQLYPGVPAVLPAATPSSSSSATTTTTSPKPTCRPPTRTSRRRRSSTRRSIGCGCRPRDRSSSAATSSSSPASRASTASDRPRRTTACWCRSSAGSAIDRDEILRKLVEIQYERNDHEFTRGTFRVRGDIVEVYPSYDDVGLRIGLFGDEIDELRVVRSADRPRGAPARAHLRLSRSRTSSCRARGRWQAHRRASRPS